MPEGYRTMAAHDAIGFESILNPNPAMQARTEPVPDRPAPEPRCFHDLCLDQILDRMTAGREMFGLDRVFCTPAPDLGTIRYRQAFWQDLEQPDIGAACRAFTRKIQSSRAQQQMVGKSQDEWSARRWFLDAARMYGSAVRDLDRALNGLKPTSDAVGMLARWLDTHLSSDHFRRLADEGEAIARDLEDIVYAVSVGEGDFRVQHPGRESDYSAEIEDTFARFRQGDVRSHLVDLQDTLGLDHIEATILAFVARLNPNVFDRLRTFCEDFATYENPVLIRLDRELHFYLAYADFIAPMRAAGLPFCCPDMSDTDKAERVADMFDPALAVRLVDDGKAVVTNDFELSGPERIIMVTGPNQGGKTTFARAFGQLHYLARLGLPVPGREAHLFLVDEIHTHFEREENAADLRGKLEDELVRIHDIVTHVSPRSLVIMNESFNATTADDAASLSAAVLEDFIGQDLICVCVTFIDEIATLSHTIVSMVSTVDPDRDDARTFRIVRRPSDGRVYAASLAHKYHLTGADIRRRLTEAP
ncbi:DNA mismatch repair protein MutS [Gluconacetobacter diazotrophicus]|uniref:DNA mismatch repair protein MutS n=2 Tax=Gluconacetobacter diazotrophicus TaxID=33996 RepID=A0A7W4I867_GLUDI|nr:DNA mismatch repair protein MutS [Gluconacetobacter diazotrophicus]